MSIVRKHIGLGAGVGWGPYDKGRRRMGWRLMRMIVIRIEVYGNTDFSVLRSLYHYVRVYDNQIIKRRF